MKVLAILITCCLGLITSVESPSLIDSKLDEVTIEVSAPMETCSCIAAGGCKTTNSQSCYIIYCDGHVEDVNFNSAPANLTVVQQLCPDP